MMSSKWYMKKYGKIIKSYTEYVRTNHAEMKKNNQRTKRNHEWRFFILSDFITPAYSVPFQLHHNSYRVKDTPVFP